MRPVKVALCCTLDRKLYKAESASCGCGYIVLDAVSGGGGWTTEELNNVATTHYECRKLECNLFWCDSVTCPNISCNGYNTR